MAYTTINKSTDYFNTVLYTGNGSAGNSITGVGFQPDFVWIKNRGNTESHAVFDAVRGVTKRIATNSSGGEETNANTVTAFGTDGFTVGTNAGVNGSGVSTVAWNWKMNGAGSSNSDGSVTTTVSVDSTAKMSIVKWTGTGSAATIGHGLGVTPDYIIVKCLDSGENWVVWSNAMAANQFLRLSTSASVGTDSYVWNNTLPTSSVFSVSSDNTTNKSGSGMVAYCFSNVKGFCKAGKYTGNGNADGTFVYTGFKPAFVLYKNSTDSATNWQIHDSARSPSNLSVNRLNPNDSSVEVTTTGDSFDLLSNGFKARGTASNSNTSAKNYIYMAFAEAPLVGSNNIPATAR